MTYFEELWVLKKKDGKYHFYNTIPVDSPTSLKLGDSFVIKSKNGNERRFRVDRLEHLLKLKNRKLDKYDEGLKWKENEYFLRIYISR